MRIVAIIAAYNEGDVIYHVIGDLIANGIEVYFIDNHSKDNTIKEASRWLEKGLINIETFPVNEGSNGAYLWQDILRRKAQLSLTLGADWYIHTDADEFRECPWPGLTLKQGIEYVDRLGYNAINFSLFNFRPVDNSFTPGTDVRTSIGLYEQPKWFDTLQIKAWKRVAPIDLDSKAGHEPLFDNRRIFPIPFILRHYPIRSELHGLQKVFADRMPRFTVEERSKGWHIQYDEFVSHQKFLHNPALLIEYSSKKVCHDLYLHTIIDIASALLLSASTNEKGHHKDAFESLSKILGNGITAMQISSAYEWLHEVMQLDNSNRKKLLSSIESCLFSELVYCLAYYNFQLTNLLGITSASSAYAAACMYLRKSIANSGGGFLSSLNSDLECSLLQVSRVFASSTALLNNTDISILSSFADLLNSDRVNPHFSLAENLTPIRNIISRALINRFDDASRAITSGKNDLPISIIIPVFNKVELTRQCLEAIYQHTPADLFELIIIENASTDGTADYLRSMGDRVRVITNHNNLGFAKACNQGAVAASGKYLLFLNNDTVPLHNWLTNLADFIAAHPDAGIVGSKLLYPDETIQHCGASMRHDGAFFRHQYKFLHRRHPLVNKVRTLDAVTAACFITPRELFMKLGGFDEQYLNGCEDMDYCTAVRKAGYKIYYQPESELYHLESQTPRANNMDADNFARYVSKWGVGSMKNEIEVYADDGFWQSSANIFTPSTNAAQLLNNLRNTFNPECREPGAMFGKVASRVYPVPFWEKR